MKQPPLRRRTRKRWPWDKDPDDREANYRRPIPMSERIRLVAKAAAVVAAFLYVRATTADGSNVGAKLLVAIGAVLVVAGSVDLAWTLRGKLDHVFITSRRLQVAAPAAVLAAGAAMLFGGTAILV